MQSSSNGMLPVLGLLACAAAAGVFAAHQWPKGPPRSLIEALDFVSCEVLHPHGSAPAPKPDYGPAPKFDGPPTGLLTPPVVDFDPPPLGKEGHGPEKPPMGTGERDAPPLCPDAPWQWVNTPPIEVPAPPAKPPLGKDHPETSIFWPNSPDDLLPGTKPVRPGARPAKPQKPAPIPATPGAIHAPAAPSDPRMEDSIRRLEQLGAVVVRFERQQGPSGNYFFRCEMPMPRNPHYRRYFQAVDSQPARAAERVAHEVEAWLATLRK